MRYNGFGRVLSRRSLNASIVPGAVEVAEWPHTKFVELVYFKSVGTFGLLTTPRSLGQSVIVWISSGADVKTYPILIQN